VERGRPIATADPGRSLRSIIPKNKRKLDFDRANCQSPFSAVALFHREKVPLWNIKKKTFFAIVAPTVLYAPRHCAVGCEQNRPDHSRSEDWTK